MDSQGSKGVRMTTIDLPGNGFSDRSTMEIAERSNGVLDRFLDVYVLIQKKSVFWACDQIIETKQIPYEEILKSRVSKRKVEKAIELELFIHGNSIGDEGVRALMTGLSSHKGKITLLDIGNNSITAKGAFYVAEYIKSSKNLLWVNLYMNDIGDEGAEKIADALKQNRTITTIDLGGNNIHAKGASQIAQVLKDNSVITTLDLAYNPIGADGAKALAEVLKFHGNISTLKLGWCQIGATGAESVADMLKYNSTVSILDLRANGLRDEGAKCLARSLKVVNEALTSLDLAFNEIRDDGAFAIAQALKANEDVTVTSLNLSSNFLTKFGQTALSDARDHVYEMNEKEVDIFF